MYEQNTLSQLYSSVLFFKFVNVHQFLFEKCNTESLTEFSQNNFFVESYTFGSLFQILFFKILIVWFFFLYMTY